ncbi:MAG TPA: hypothetical protein VKW78_20375 [Terriglobales bacterium]|nr:hypothetical protein [Terriglobales bacterium]
MSETTAFGAAICQHIRIGGQRCTQPARRNSNYCRFHTAALQSPPAKLSELTEQLPPLEDLASIQIALMKVIQFIMKHPYEAQNARPVLYGLQLAANNLARTRNLTDAAHRFTDKLPTKAPTSDPESQTM